MTRKNITRPTGLRRRLLIIVAILSIGGLVSAGYFVQELGYRVTGYAAKQACSFVNVTGQPLGDALNELREDNPLLEYAAVKWVPDTGTVQASVFGLFRNTAVYRPPLGAVLVYPGYETAIEAFPRPKPEKAFVNSNRTSPFIAADRAADTLSPIDGSAMAEALAYAMGEPSDGGSTRRTRALLVVWEGQIIAEKYHPGFEADSLLLGWSMSKSILNLSIGRRIYQGAMSLEGTKLRPERLRDNRRSISLEQLLRMESGLRFSETYSPLSNVLTMLYRRPDMGGYAASFKREAETSGASLWSYSSGTTNILSDQLRRSFRNDKEYVQFLLGDLLLPIGIRTAQLEFDASGTWVASSYVYATARDWARFGKLVLDDGLWEGRRLLPVGWITKSMTPIASYRSNDASGDPPGLSYGMQWWINRKNAAGENWMPSVPEDMITAWGHFHQYMTVIPSRQLIVVRLGLSKGPNGWDYQRFLSMLLSALPEQSPQKESLN